MGSLSSECSGMRDYTARIYGGSFDHQTSGRVSVSSIVELPYNYLFCPPMSRDIMELSMVDR